MKRPALLSLIGIASALAGGAAVALWPNAAPPLRVANIFPKPPPAPRAAEPEQKPDAARTEATPSFDIVRVTKEGDTVIAGRAEPLAEVRVSDGATELGTTKADARGEWMLLPEKKIAPGDRQLSLSAVQPRSGAVVKGDAEVALSVPQRQSGSSSGAPLAVLLPSSPETPARPLQLPVARAPASDALALETVEYDAAGQMSLSGHGKAGSELTLHLNDRSVATARVGPDGRWTAQPPARVEPGLYTLRVDELGPGGKVVGRLTLPFQRAEVPSGARPGEWLVVQPGHSLWRIARQTYGAGVRYTEVYAENRVRIANPDLIYPGQALKLPSN
jgi:nucleoid-associated protein YgaU